MNPLWEDGHLERMKRYLVAFCLVIAGGCVGLFLAESFTRVFYPHIRDSSAPAGLFSIDHDLGWKLNPGKKAIHHTRYFDVVYTTNGLGFRDKPRNVVKDNKTYRILLYGDSLIFGWGVPAEKRFSNLIETQRRPLEIWNLAVPGYGLDQEILSYERDGRSLNADQVIFFVSRSTLSRIRTGYIYDKYKPVFEISPDGKLRLISIPRGKSAINSLLYQILSPLYLPYFVERQLVILKETLNKSSYIKTHRDDTQTRLIGDLEEKILSLARSITLEKNQRMTVLADLPEATRKDLRKFCQQNGIGFLEINLDDYKVEDFTFGKDDRHWDVRAHRLIAEQLLLQIHSYDKRGG